MNVLDVLAKVLAGLTILTFIAVTFLFEQGNWHDGKRILAATAVFGFLHAIVFWIAVARR